MHITFNFDQQLLKKTLSAKNDKGSFCHYEDFGFAKLLQPRTTKR